MKGRVFSYRHVVGADGRATTVKDPVDPDTGRTPKGVKWAFEFAVPAPPTGKRKSNRKSVSKAGFAGQRAAQRALTDALAEYEAGDRKVPTEPSRAPLSAFVTDEWLPAVRHGMKATTAENYEVLHRAYIAPHIGDAPLRDITPGHLTRLYELLSTKGGRRGQPLSDQTVHHVHVMLSTVFGYAVEAHHLKSNPAAAIPRSARRKQPKRSPDRLRYWTANEATTFLTAMADDRLYALWALALNVGLRRGELAGLQWSDLALDDPAAGSLAVARQLVTVGREVNESTPKTSASARTIELDEGVVRVLRAHRKRQLEEKILWGAAWEGTDWVFATEKGLPLHPASIGRKLEAAAGRAKVPAIGVHGLRHTCATLMFVAGTPFKVVSERLGHTSTAITMDLYQHVVPGAQRSASAAISLQLGIG